MSKKQKVSDEMIEIKAQIHLNNIKFDVYKSFVNKNLSEMDNINTENRKLYERLGILMNELEGV